MFHFKAFLEIMPPMLIPGAIDAALNPHG